MKKRLAIIFFTTLFLSCNHNMDDGTHAFLENEIPSDIPIAFKQHLVPENRLIHKGIFSPDLEAYYYTISDKNFEQFQVYVIKKQNGKWSDPANAFFDSQYNEHGMTFSPDGNSLYFSSTRPTPISEIPNTWHIWKSDKINGEWSTPTFVDIPNLRNKLVSHPTLTNSGKLYFHSSNLDYSDMDIYHSQEVNGAFEAAEKVLISIHSKVGKCTPYVSPQEDYLIFASIVNQLDLMISFNNGKGGWTEAKKLNSKINHMGQGNPYVTPDNTFLFFTTGGHQEKNWEVKWVNIESEIQNK